MNLLLRDVNRKIYGKIQEALNKKSHQNAPLATPVKQVMLYKAMLKKTKDTSSCALPDILW